MPVVLPAPAIPPAGLDTITTEALRAALDRGVRFRAWLALAAGAPAWRVRHEIAGLARPRRLALSDSLPGGWIWVGDVVDTIGTEHCAHCCLRVHWHPATDRVRVARPQPIRAPRDQALRDIVGTAGGRCFPGWRHTRGGSYCPPCAELLRADRPDAFGWSATRMAPDETYVCARCGKVVTIDG